MKKTRIGLIGAALMALATVATPVSIAQANTPTQTTEQSNSKATKPETQKRNRKTVYQVGGIGIEGQISVGISPKQYGIMYGAKKHGKKSNRLRYSHDAKVARR